MKYEEALELVKKCGFNIEAPFESKVEELVTKALERQIKKKPIVKKSVKVNAFMLRCPNGECEAVLQSDTPCCKYCGQALDWRALEETEDTK